jgi:hypothetical protein
MGATHQTLFKTQTVKHGFEIMVVVGGIKLHPQSIMLLHHEFLLLYL